MKRGYCFSCGRLRALEGGFCHQCRRDMAYTRWMRLRAKRKEAEEWGTLGASKATGATSCESE